MTEERTIVYWNALRHDAWHLFVAATDKGLCCITLPNETFDTLQRWVDKHFNKAVLIRDEVMVRTYAEQIEEYLSERRKSFSVPLDLKGTAFQIRVWRALLAIAFGTTRSYSEVAAEIGRPAAVRAVGAANGANPVPIVVPCHRVIGKGGGLTGYRGGMEMKETLLRLEAASPTFNGTQ